jgi:LytR cell envelope-related transcriptional attenuator
VDHPLSASEALVRPWRTAAYVAVAIAALELVLLLVIGGGVLLDAASARLQLEARDRALASPRDSQKPSVRKPEPAPAAKRPRSATVVLVLNGNGRTGAAAAAASRVRHRGYKIGRVGNASQSDFARSIVMYRPGFAGEGRRLARDLGVKQVGPLDGMRAGDLGRAQVVFILGA